MAGGQAFRTAPTYAWCGSGRPDRRLGRGQHAARRSSRRCGARRPSPPQPAAHPHALLRRLGFLPGPWRLRRNWVKPRLRARRADGRRPPAEEAGRAPSFVVRAVKDPNGGNLDRIQIIKRLDQERLELQRRSSMSPFPAAASPTTAAATCRRSRAPLTWTWPPTANDHRRRLAEGRLARPRVRSQTARRLLRPRAGNPDAALDHPASGHRKLAVAAARRGAGHAAGARLVLRPSGTPRVPKPARMLPSQGMTVADLKKRRAQPRWVTPSSRR